MLSARHLNYVICSQATPAAALAATRCGGGSGDDWWTDDDERAECDADKINQYEKVTEMSHNNLIRIK